MASSPEQLKRLAQFKDRAEELGFNELFTDEPGVGLSLGEMAVEMWMQGFIPIPTRTALLEAMEAELEQATGLRLKEVPMGQ